MEKLGIRKSLVHRKTNTQSKQRDHTRISQENGFSAEAGGAEERIMIPKNLKRKDGQILGTDWASGRGKGLGAPDLAWFPGCTVIPLITITDDRRSRLGGRLSRGVLYILFGRACGRPD